MAKGDFRQSWERVPEGPKPEGPPVYTPTTEEVRDGYWINDGGISDPEDAKRFDRWLASVRADAWDEGFNAGEQDVWIHSHSNDWDAKCVPNPYRSEKQ